MNTRTLAGMTLGFALAVASHASTARAQTIAWQRLDTPGALAQLRAQTRPVLLEMAAEWCIPCQRMEVAVWSQRDVISATNRGFVPVKIDWDSEAGQQARARFNIKSLPVVIGLRADGTEIDRLEGEADPQFVSQVLAAWQANRSSLPVLESWLRAHPDDLLRRVDAGMRYVQARDVARATEHLERAVALDANNARGHAASALFALGDKLFLRGLNDPNRAVAPLRTLTQRFATSNAGLKGFISLATALHRTQHDSDARAALDAYARAGTTDAMTIASRTANAITLMREESWDLPGAEQLGRRVLATAPRNPALLDALAAVLFARGQRTEALTMEQSAVRYEPGNREFRARLEQYTRAQPPTATSTVPKPPAPAGVARGRS